MHCSFCAKKIIKPGFTHVNIQQPTKIRHFCSKLCKESWCFEIQSSNARKVVVWSIGAYFQRFFFVKKILKLRSASILSDLTNKSFFSDQLSECAYLELDRKKDGKFLLKVIRKN